MRKNKKYIFDTKNGSETFVRTEGKLTQEVYLGNSILRRTKVDAPTWKDYGQATAVVLPTALVFPPLMGAYLSYVWDEKFQKYARLKYRFQDLKESAKSRLRKRMERATKLAIGGALALSLLYYGCPKLFTIGFHSSLIGVSDYVLDENGFRKISKEEYNSIFTDLGPGDQENSLEKKLD